MSLDRDRIRRGWLATAGFILHVATGCSGDEASPTNSPGGSVSPGMTTNPASATANGGMSAAVGSAAGTTGTGTGSGTGVAPPAPQSAAAGVASTPKPASGGTGASTSPGEFAAAGKPAMPMMMSTAGTSAMSAGASAPPPAMEAGTGAPPPAMAACDTSGFMQDCKKSGWGSPAQLGPCASAETIYTVKVTYGPYGVRSKYNVGQAFNTGNGPGDFTICPAFIDSFGADPAGSADLKDTHDLDFGLYTIYYPGCMPEGEKFPLITWGNGTCAMPEGYGPLLRFVASHGYIVVAANSLQTGAGTQMRKAIDFMFAENKDEKSEFYQKIDEEKVGAMGHSQGGMGTIAAASDPRIKSVIIWNGGTSASKPFLAVSGDRDIGGTPAGMRNAVDAAPRPAAWLFYHQIPAAVNGSTTGQSAPGHLTLMMEAERVQTVAVKWWDMMLKNDAEAKTMFVGPDCGICKGTELQSMWITGAEKTGPSHEYGANALLK